MKKRGLGKGLGALHGDDVTKDNETSVNTKLVAIDKLQPNSFQPRTNFDEKPSIH